MPTTFPTGWFLIAFSDELTHGELRSLRYFSRDLVLFRGEESGEAIVLDAHCPHLGAHLGVGGSVRGEHIRCPFHAWEFNRTGRCVHIPYAERIPRQARTTAWRVEEHSGMIFLWHAPPGVEPDYRIPEVPELDDPDWMPWNHSILEIETHPREIVENVVDKQHFPTVHGTYCERFDNEFDGHRAIQHSAGVAHPRGGGEDRFELTATYHGPGYQETRMEGVLSSRMVNAHTPIDEERLHLRFAVSLPVLGTEEKTRRFSSRYIDNLRVGFHEDIAMWEHKTWRSPPVLCRGDGPIGKLRRWYQQFYEIEASGAASDS